MSGQLTQSLEDAPMLYTRAIALVVTLAFGGAAHAAEGQIAHAHCKALAKLEAEFDAKTHVVQLTAGQFHFVEGVYAGSPNTPDGLPPGDGALLVSHDGDKDGIIVWTRGALACAPISVNERLIRLIVGIKTGALDGEGDEL
jgi:hypothetical protein